MMLRDILLLVVVLGSLMTSFASEAQQAAGVARVGVLVPGPPGPFVEAAEALRQGLRQHEWIEGQNLILDFRYADGRYERLPALVSCL